MIRILIRTALKIARTSKTRPGYATHSRVLLSHTKCMKNLLVTCLLCNLTFVFGQNKINDIPKKIYTTQRLNSPVKLDGLLDDAAWSTVDWGGDFTQYQPNEGKPPSVQTQFKILYDNKFLYLGFRCHDASPDSIDRRMGRRDEFPGDWVEINIDAYHDLRTAFSFTLAVSGVRNDEFISNNGGHWDTSWNPIWFAKTNVDEKGWTGEAKIPLSQLRYGKEPDKVWGIQVMRRLFRKEERSTWQYIPQNTGVWVSSFGELHGLEGIPSQKQIEIAPYIVAQSQSAKAEAGNPFATGKDSKITGGIDGKIAITSDLILDFTVNPDFGQVEADPSQVRIDGFQNFFEERRPFFIESRNIFDYRLTGSEAGGDYDADLLFYSRRIGSSPHGYPSTSSGEYADVPQNTSILGAAKFSGKTPKGWSIGILESITQREMATIDKNSERRQELVEPSTSYFVGRVQKDIKAGNTVLGGIFTGVNREEGLSDLLHRNAYSGGFDFLHFWKNRTWYVRGNVIFSHVNGTKEAILNTQTKFEHLFQRPNATEVSVDPNRTSLTGTGGTFNIGKTGGKPGKYGQIFKFESGVTYRSPQLELNDIGFMLTSNEINHYTWASVQFQRQRSIYRNARINYNHWQRWDFGGQKLYQAFNTNAHIAFLNNWQTGSGLTVNTYDASNNALRGGSTLLRPQGIGHFIYMRSDSRKKIMLNFNANHAWGFGKTVRNRDYTATVRVQPVNALNFSIQAGYGDRWRKQDQYVSQQSYNGEVRTIVSEVSQKLLRFTGRLNYNITPDLTLQYYGQPFITRPLFSNFGYVTNPLSKNFEDRFHRYTASEISFDNGTFSIDENRDGKTDYTFGKPDFNFVQFRSNLVLRWEYIAGSELYLVWAQSSTPDVADDLDTPLSSSLFNNAFGQEARNILLLKMTYRFLK
jgi:Domain of unknown function (DUF5916)/Carbohydrate family 9 binding domain-like